LTELSDYVSLKEFDGGSSGWYNRVHADGLRFIKIFERLTGNQLGDVARAMGGEIVNTKFYDDVAWTIKVRPLPFLDVLLLLTLDPEFGNDFFTYYSRSALGKVPTEDIIAYSWVYTALLAWEAQKTLRGEEPKFEREEMAEAQIDERVKIFKYIDPMTAQKVADIIGGKSKAVEGASWAIEKEAIPKFTIVYMLRNQIAEIRYSKEMLERFKYCRDFLWLYCNAIIRESRKILGDKMPTLSASGIL
jgi:hypothetical protein